MLEQIGISSISELIDQTVPDSIRFRESLNLPESISERRLIDRARELASQNEVFRSYIGLGYHGTVTPTVILRNIIEPHGVLCRFGGDEFVACLPGIAIEQAQRIASEVRDQVAKHNFVKNGIKVSPTVSIGVAGYPVHAQTPEALFSAADQALYRAKRKGKNTVVMSTQEPSE